MCCHAEDVSDQAKLSSIQRRLQVSLVLGMDELRWSKLAWNPGKLGFQGLWMVL